jgi:hypothetical protein
VAPRHVSVSWDGDSSAFFCERRGGILEIVAAIEGLEAIAGIGELLSLKAP